MMAVLTERPDVAEGVAHLRFEAGAQVAFLADVHLSEDEPETFALWQHTLRHCEADALFILGDCFEVWVGDDWGLQDEFALACAEVLQELSARVPVYFLHGNRDFLLGPAFAAHCGLRLLPPQALLELGPQRVLLAHGDEWMLGEPDYMAFRQKVRQAAWQADFLAQPLAQRLTVAQQLREQSRAAQAKAAGQGSYQSDIDISAAAASMRAVGAAWLIHGHTHKPGCGTLAPGLLRWVLSDWSATGSRGDVLHLNAEELTRQTLRWKAAERDLL